MQTYFAAKGRINYFVVVDIEEDEETAGGSMSLTKPEKELFKQLEKGYKDVKCDIEKPKCEIIPTARSSKSSPD